MFQEEKKRLTNVFGETELFSDSGCRELNADVLEIGTRYCTFFLKARMPSGASEPHAACSWAETSSLVSRRPNTELLSKDTAQAPVCDSQESDQHSGKV